MLNPPDSALVVDRMCRKLAVKLLQRLGLAYLPPRATRWRYTTSATSLEASLGPGMPKEVAS